MSKLGKFGALAGLGQGISQYGESLRQQWLMQAQARQQDDLNKAAEGRSNQEWSRREGITRTNNRADNATQQGYTVDLEGVRHDSAVELRGTPNAADRDKPEFWRADDVSYKVEGGRTFALRPGSNQWEQVAEPGEAASLPIDPYELEQGADEYADKRVSEASGVFSLDSTDFADHGGSREKARETFRKEFLAGRGAASAPNATAATSDIPPGLNNLAVEKRDFALDALDAIKGQIPRDAVVARLMEKGFTDDEIRAIGI